MNFILIGTSKPVSNFIISPTFLPTKLANCSGLCTPKNFNLSTFLARRGAIGGTKSLLRAYVPGLAIMGGGGAAVAGSPGPVGDWAESTGVVKALLVMMLLRKGAGFFASPVSTNLMVDALEASQKKVLDPTSMRNVVRALRPILAAEGEVFFIDMDNTYEAIQSRAKRREKGEAFLEELETRNKNLDLEFEDIVPVMPEQIMEEAPMSDTETPMVEDETQPKTMPERGRKQFQQLSNVVQPLSLQKTQRQGQALFGATDPVFGGVFAKKGGLVNLVNSYGKK